MIASQFKFIQEYPEFRDVLNVTSFADYKAKLVKVKKNLSEQEYNYVSGFSFEFIIGYMLHLYGGMPEFGVMDYQPTYVGSYDNPDHGADGFGRAFADIPDPKKPGNVIHQQSSRTAIVQIKFRSNRTDQVRSFGNLPAVVATRLMTEETVNVTLITLSSERKTGIDIHAQEVDSSVVGFAKEFKKCFTKEMAKRIYIRVIDINQLEKFDNFYFWQQLRIFSGLF